MEFGLSEEQVLLTESLNGFLSQQQPLEQLRKNAASGLGFDQALWKGLVEQGITGMLVPEEHGGSGLKLLDAAVVVESLGYHVAATPFIGSIALATQALRASGSESQQAEWLPQVSSGEVRIAVGFGGHVGQTGNSEVALDSERLSGCVRNAIDGGAATHVIAYLPDGRAALAPIDAEGMSSEIKLSLDRTRPLTDLIFKNTPVTVLNGSNDPAAARLKVLDAGRVLFAADTLGAAQFMLDKALEYSKERVQFERVIGSFQGVKHTLADMVTTLEPCRSLVWFAAYAQDELPDEARIAALQAKAHLGDVGRDMARLATEVHGGMGFTELLGIHYWYKRIAFNRQVLGAPELCRHEAAVEQGWAAAY
jgi:alkylation response protein AidB-like acyl-CoA dehydrogenase